MRRWRERRHARGLKSVVTWVARVDKSPPPPLERRLHEARDREVPGSAIRAWRRILKLPWPRIAERLTVQSKEGLELRSTAPLFGLLTARERRRILGAFSLPASTTR